MYDLDSCLLVANMLEGSNDGLYGATDVGPNHQPQLLERVGFFRGLRLTMGSCCCGDGIRPFRLCRFSNRLFLFDPLALQSPLFVDLFHVGHQGFPLGVPLSIGNRLFGLLFSIRRLQNLVTRDRYVFPSSDDDGHPG